MKVYIYNENCTRAGRNVTLEVLEAHDDPDNAGDWTMYEGTEDELECLARDFDARNEKDRGSNFWGRCADSIREEWSEGKEREVDHV